MWSTKLLPGVAGLTLSLLASSVSAAFIVSSASCPGASSCDSTVTDNYGFEFKIEATSTPTTSFSATLTNTSTTSLADALIDAVAFNMNPTLTLGTDFTIGNISPVWTFQQITAGAIQFDYVGDRTTPGTRIGPGAALTFDFTFVDPQTFDLWLTSDAASCGVGLGGGTDCGQVAVTFQQLGSDGEDSDLLVAGWEEGPDDPGSIPEPASLALIGLGLAGLGAMRRRRS